jgi:hypothetical protein
MAYGNLLADVVQSSVTGTPTVFKDGAGTETGQLCRAWVNFNGTGTVAIRASFNVSSITDNGTGDYTVIFITAMPDANYVGEVTAGRGSGSNTRQVSGPNAAPTTSAFRIATADSTGTLTDLEYINVAIFR